MKSIAFFYSDNGFGHLRRILLFYNYFKKKKFHCTIFGNKKKINYLANKIKIKDLNIINFKDPRFYFDKNFSFNNFFFKKKINLKKFDIVISDTLIEILFFEKKTIILASFLWHRSLRDVSPNYFRFAENLIKKNKPIIFSSKNFVSTYLKKFKNYKINLIHKKKDPLINKKKNRNILISIGKSKLSLIEMKQFIKGIINQYKNKQKHEIPFDFLFVEGKILPKKFPFWIKKATYTPQMYKKITASVIRPGVGTITDSLRYSSKIFTFHEKNNIEMQYNSKMISELKYGISCKNYNDAFKKAINYCNSKSEISNFIKLSNKIKFNGDEQMYDIFKYELKLL